MERLHHQLGRVWTTFKSIPEMVHGYFRIRLDRRPRNDRHPRNDARTQQSAKFQISKDAIISLSEHYDRTVTSRFATLDQAYEILTHFGCQIIDLDGSLTPSEYNLQLQSWLDIFCHLLALVETLCSVNVFNDITDTRKKVKTYCKTWQTLFKVRYEFRWVACLLMDIFGRNSEAGGFVLGSVNSAVPVIDCQIERHLRIPLLHIYEPKLQTFSEDFIIDMIQCLDMHKEEIGESILPYVVTLRDRLSLLVPQELGGFLPVQKLELC